MTRPDAICLVLAQGTSDGLAASTIGKLTPRLSHEDNSVDIVLHDTFEQHVHDTGSLLITRGRRLELWQSDGTVLCQPTPKSVGFVGDLPDGPVKAALATVPALRSLMPVGSAKLRRADLALVDDEEKTQVRAQLRTLAGDHDSVVIATVQGLRGYDKAFERFRSHLSGSDATTLGQGDVYSALFSGYAPYVPKPDVGITRAEDAIDTASDIIAAYIPVARKNEAGVIADIDTEFLHDYRIALRKIRSVLSLFKGVYDETQTQELKTRFSALMAETGRLRDLDVYLLEQDVYYDLLPASLHGGLDRMFAIFAQERAQAQQALAEHLQGKSYEAEIDKLARLFRKRTKLRPGPNAKRHAHDYACALIWKRYRKICRIAEAIDAQTPDEDVHELRIHCKKLRYLMEFFAPLFPKEAFKSLIKPLKRLQDNLGLFNDYSVQQEALSVFLATHETDKTEQDLDLAQSVGALIVVLHQRQLAERNRVVQSFVQFNSPATQTTFRKLFHAGKARA